MVESGAAASLPASNSAELTVGMRIGTDICILENSPRLLRLGTRSATYPLMLILGVAGVAAWADWLITRHVHPWGAGATVAAQWALIVGASLILMGGERLRMCFTADGSAKTLVRQHMLFTRRYREDQLQSVFLSVMSSRAGELLYLGLSRRSGGKPLLVTFIPTSTPDATIIAAGRRIAQLLSLPVVMYGKPLEASPPIARAAASAVAQGAIAAGPEPLRITCPRCGTQDTPATAYDRVERFKGVVPWTTTWLCCTACKTELYSRVRVSELYRLSPQERRRAIIYRPPLAPIRGLLAVLALVFAVLPVIGTVVALLALLTNLRYMKWARTCSLIGLALSLVTTSILAYNLAMNPAPPPIPTTHRRAHMLRTPDGPDETRASGNQVEAITLVGPSA